ncbi:MAG TPA: hypothetical protein VIW22_06370 [Nitrososphaerales archaeon]
MTTIQGLIGGPIAGGVGGGVVIVASTSFGDVFSAIMGSSGLLIFHAFEGVLIVVLALAVSVLSFGCKSRGVRVFAILSLIAALITATAGYLHMGGNSVGIPVMGEGFIATYAFLFMTLYSTK